jgi:hypothetical protein
VISLGERRDIASPEAAPVASFSVSNYATTALRHVAIDLDNTQWRLWSS